MGKNGSIHLSIIRCFKNQHTLNHVYKDNKMISNPLQIDSDLKVKKSKLRFLERKDGVKSPFDSC